MLGCGVAELLLPEPETVPQARPQAAGEQATAGEARAVTPVHRPFKMRMTAPFPVRMCSVKIAPPAVAGGALVCGVAWWW